MNPRKSARSNAASKEKNLLQMANEMTKDTDDDEKAEMAYRLDEVARLIRQKLHCVRGGPVQSTPFENELATLMRRGKLVPERCWQCIKGKS
jgi:hypothetical protein